MGVKTTMVPVVRALWVFSDPNTRKVALVTLRKDIQKRTIRGTTKKLHRNLRLPNVW